MNRSSAPEPPVDAAPERIASLLVPGTTAERSFVVGEADTAQSTGGDFPVLATPTLILWTELVASDLIRDRSAGRLGSFGTRVDVRHSEAAAPGDRITVAMTVKSSIFQMVRFTVLVTHDARKTILLSGEHDRALVHRPL
jgi:predicted thioesterase